jgi:hypothetical protein
MKKPIDDHLTKLADAAFRQAAEKVRVVTIIAVTRITIYRSTRSYARSTISAASAAEGGLAR